MLSFFAIILYYFDMSNLGLPKKEKIWPSCSKQAPVPKPLHGQLGRFAFDNNIYMTDGTRRSSSGIQSPHAAGVSTRTVPAEGDKNKFVSLQVAKGTVVLNPYAGIPADSPKHMAKDCPRRVAVDSPKRVAVDSPKRAATDSPKHDAVDSPLQRQTLASPSRHSTSSAEYAELNELQQITSPNNKSMLVKKPEAPTKSNLK